MMRSHSMTTVKGAGTIITAVTFDLADPALAEDEDQREADDCDDEAGEDVVVEAI
jgi:hypothetical protein